MLFVPLEINHSTCDVGKFCQNWTCGQLSFYYQQDKIRQWVTPLRKTFEALYAALLENNSQMSTPYSLFKSKLGVLTCFVLHLGL